ncbi:MAG: HAD-IIB family hydrolase [Oscillospiraceae bacterium]|nr:HAD-IIB family hydrolase [Oscillospiraceae bacterium]
MVVFFDIDGTVVDYDTQIIPESAVEAVRLLKKNGHLPIVNTGRPIGHVDPRVQKLDFSGWICSCGMELILDGEMIYQDYPSQEECRKILELAHDCRMAIQTEGHDSLLFDADLPYHALGLREAERLAAQGIRVEPIQNSADLQFIKFVTYDTPGCDRARFLRETAPYFDSIIRANTMVEYIKKGHSKAEGMERFLKELHVPKEEIFAIGDSENDLPMFAMAGTTICLGDGVEAVKKVVDYVTDPVLGDGVFNALHHFGLI